MTPKLSAVEERAANICSMCASDTSVVGLVLDDEFRPQEAIDIADAALSDALRNTRIFGRALWAEAECRIRNRELPRPRDMLKRRGE